MIKHDMQFLVLTTDHHIELTKAKPTSKINATTVARFFLEHWMPNYDISSKILTGNNSEFVANFFGVVCSTLGMDNITTTEYHTHTAGQVKRFSTALISRLRHYVSENETDRDTFLLQSTNAYNVHVYKSIQAPHSAWCLHELPLARPQSCCSASN